MTNDEYRKAAEKIEKRDARNRANRGSGLTPEQAKKVGRGRTIALSYSAMVPDVAVDPGGGIDAAVVGCILDLLHAATNEPFERAGQMPEAKRKIAEDLVDVALFRFDYDLGGP